MRFIVFPRLFPRPGLTPIPQRVEELMSRLDLPIRVFCRYLGLRLVLHEKVEVLLYEDLSALAREVLRWGLRAVRRFV